MDRVRSSALRDGLTSPLAFLLAARFCRCKRNATLHQHNMHGGNGKGRKEGEGRGKTRESARPQRYRNVRITFFVLPFRLDNSSNNRKAKQIITGKLRDCSALANTLGGESGTASGRRAQTRPQTPAPPPDRGLRGGRAGTYTPYGAGGGKTANK